MYTYMYMYLYIYVYVYEYVYVSVNASPCMELAPEIGASNLHKRGRTFAQEPCVNVLSMLKFTVAWVRALDPHRPGVMADVSRRDRVPSATDPGLLHALRPRQPVAWPQLRSGLGRAEPRWAR